MENVDYDNLFCHIANHGLVSERNKWREQMEQGTFPRPEVLKKYEANRKSELWRAARQHEQILEYVLFLEERLQELSV